MPRRMLKKAEELKTKATEATENAKKSTRC